MATPQGSHLGITHREQVSNPAPLDLLGCQDIFSQKVKTWNIPGQANIYYAILNKTKVIPGPRDMHHMLYSQPGFLPAPLGQLSRAH